MKQVKAGAGLFFITFFTFTLPLSAGVRLSPFFTSNMVLQQNSDVKLFGDADPGEEITVVLSWAKHTYRVTTAPDGTWETEVRTPGHGGPYEISFYGRDTVSLSNILIGEVWFAAGQSNMEMTLGKTDREVLETDSSYDSRIRFFITPRRISDEPQAYPAAGEGWQVCTPETSSNLSAIAYYFSKKLHDDLNVPVGIIVSAWGGTPAEAWMSEDALSGDSLFNPIYERWSAWRTRVSGDSIAYGLAAERWIADSLAGRPARKPEIPQSIYMMTRPQRQPSVLYNSMVAPFLRVRVRGIIWYQGTSNKEWHNEYEHLFRTLIASWRKAWRLDELPFYYVQIAPYGYQYPEQGAGIREAQLKVMNTPGCGMAVTMDCGDRDNLHPSDKKTPGERLALWALAKTYGADIASFSGPVLRSAAREMNGIRLFFDYADGGLSTSDGKPARNFYIAGESGDFFPAEVIMDKESLFLSSASVNDPRYVTYAFGNVFDANFININGLPASPFRTELKE